MPNNMISGQSARTPWYLLTVLVVAYLLMLFVHAQGLAFPVAGFAHFVDGIFIYAIGLIILNRTRGIHDKTRVTLYFSLFFILIGVFEMMLFLPYITLYRPQTNPLYFPVSMYWATVTARIFLYGALAFLVRASVRIFMPNLNTLIFYFIAAFGLMVTIVNMNMPAYPVYDALSGLSITHDDLIVTQLLAAITVLSAASAIILFTIGAFTGSDAKERRSRCMRIALSILVITVFGLAHEYVTSTISFIIADIIMLGGFMLLAATLLQLPDLPYIVDSEEQLFAVSAQSVQPDLVS